MIDKPKTQSSDRDETRNTDKGGDKLDWAHLLRAARFPITFTVVTLDGKQQLI